MGNQRNISLLFAFAVCTALTPSLARADQASAQQDAQKTHDNGSTDSLNSSYGNALNALGNFYQLNIPGAISHGVKAYGQYRNSQTMDDLRDRNQQLAGLMASAVGASAASASSVTGNYVSPYARLDTAFLRTGEAAAKLEKLSGISREAMFRMAVDAHTTAKSPNDPDFVPWAMSTYNGLVAKLPETEFRSGLQTFGKLAQKGIDAGLAQDWLAKVTSPAGEPATMLAKAEDMNRAPAAEAAPAPLAAESAPEPAAQLAKEETPLDASLGFTARGTATTGLNASLLGLDRLGAEPVDGFLGDAMKRAAENNGPSIFQTVSGKIKELSVRQRLERTSALAQLPR